MAEGANDLIFWWWLSGLLPESTKFLLSFPLLMFLPTDTESKDVLMTILRKLGFFPSLVRGPKSPSGHHGSWVFAELLPSSGFIATMLSKKLPTTTTFPHLHTFTGCIFCFLF